MKYFSSLLISALLALHAQAEDGPAKDGPSAAEKERIAERIKGMSDEDKQAFEKRRAELREKLKDLSPEMREKIKSMTPEERRAAFAEMSKKAVEKSGEAPARPSEAKGGEEAKSPESDEKKKRRAEVMEKTKGMSAEERQAFIEEMKKKRDQRGEKTDVQEGGVIPKRP